jgi:thioredoxin reductase (NADPH)
LRHERATHDAFGGRDRPAALKSSAPVAASVAGFVRLAESYDVAVVGGGHAGLQAGLKAALLNYHALVIDRGSKFGRSYYAPKMDNIPGFPDGISGHKLLDAQIAAVRAVAPKAQYVAPATVTEVRRVDDGFETEFGWLAQPRKVRSKVVVLALGVVDRMPVVNEQIDPIFPWANFAIVEFCVLCDGHTLPGRSVGVIGHDAFAVRTALDLVHFGPSSVELLLHGGELLEGSPPDERLELMQRLEEARVPVVGPKIVGFDGIREKRFVVRLEDGSTRGYDKGFSALGWYDQHRHLPERLGASFDPDGYVRIDDDSRVLDAEGKPIPGLYCAGDLASGWNQIPEAWAQAERAMIHAYASYL